MCTTEWTVYDLQELDREVRKILTDVGARHPRASVPLLYLSRSMGGRGMKYVEQEYMETKIKTAVHLYSSNDPVMKAVAQIDQQRKEKGRRSIMKDAEKFATKLDIEINSNRENTGWKIKYMKDDGAEIIAATGKKVKEVLQKARQVTRKRELEDQKWLGQLTTHRWADNTLDGQSCFIWLKQWKECPVDVVADIDEIYQQLLPTRIYYQVKLGQEILTNQCRLCNNLQETVAHVLTGCPRLTQTEYLYRHNNGMKCPYFSLLKHYNLITKIPPWNSVTTPKPVVENTNVSIHWDIPIYPAGGQMIYNQEQGNWPDVVVYDHVKKEIVIEFSCPWITNREIQFTEKQEKYQEVRKELKERYYGIWIQSRANQCYCRCPWRVLRWTAFVPSMLPRKIRSRKSVENGTKSCIVWIRTKNLFKSSVNANT